MTSVRWGGLVLAMLWLVGCGAVEGEGGPQPSRAGPSLRDARTIGGLGIEAELPTGWAARILVGAEGRPVLHAASFPLPANDDDSGSVAQQIIGSAGMAYVNVRDL